MIDNIVYLDDVVGHRIDPHQFHPERIAIIERIKKQSWCKLNDVIKNVKTTTSFVPKGETYIGLENIESNTGIYTPSDIEIISSAAKFKKGDILFPKLRPYLNKVHLAQFDGYCSTEFMIFEANNILPEFLTIVLRSNIVLAQTKHLMTGNTHPRLQPDDIANLFIPYPNIEKQKEIILIYQKAQKARLNKDNEATRLIEGIEDCIANKLQLSTIRKGVEKHQPFTQKLSSLIGSRFDVPYHAGIKDAIRQAEEVPYKALGEIAVFSSEGWDQKSIFTNTFPYIEISSINTTEGCIEEISYVLVNKAPSRAKKIVRKDDILISTTRPNRGAICIYNHNSISIASTGFSVIRETDNCILKEYLYLALRLSSSLEQMSLRCSGGNYPAITESELKKILIPIPSITIQENIIESIAKMRNKARLLQEQGNQLMEAAKHKIENIILG